MDTAKLKTDIQIEGYSLQQYKSQSVRGIPLFQIGNHAFDFDGTVAFILQGLGDLVNGLGVIRLLKSQFPRGKWLVFMDPVWKDFESVLKNAGGIEIVHLPLAGRYGQELLVEDKNDTDTIAAAFKIVHDRSLQSPVFLGISLQVGTLPDTYASHESTLQTNCRLIGLSCEEYAPRPWAPFSDEDMRGARLFLQKNNLEGRPFIVIAPHVDPRREWGMNHFHNLANTIRTQMGIEIVVVGLEKLGYVESDGVVHGFGLSLAVVSALISLSHLFIGHDSGLTHIAASFDIPVIAIYAKWDSLLPFETRPHSPYVTMVIDSRPGLQSSAISMETVVSTVKKKLSGELALSPSCWACGRGMDYVVSGAGNILIVMCSCGCMEAIESSSDVCLKDFQNKKHFPSLEKKDESFQLRLPSYNLNVKHFISIINNTKDSFLEINEEFPGVPNFGHLLPVKESIGKIVWSFEGLVMLMKREGWFLDSSYGHQDGYGKWIGKVVFKKGPGSSHTVLIVPWNGKTLRIYPDTPYEVFFSWQSWAFRKSKLEDLIRRASSWKDFRTAFHLSRTIFSVIREPRILLRLLKLKWKILDFRI